jgi:DNA polymerase III subunit epsilon
VLLGRLQEAVAAPVRAVATPSGVPRQMRGGEAPPGYAVVDVEATGRSPWRHRVVEIGVVLLDRFLRTEAEFTTLLDPRGPVGPTHVHRITQADVAEAPRFREVAPHLLAILTGRLLVGHHVACDRAFLEREFHRIGVALPAVPTLCTMRLARDRLTAARGLGLQACAEAAGLPPYAAHTALGDARATADLLRHCAGLLPVPGSSGGPAGRAGGPEWTAALREAAALEWPSAAVPGGRYAGRTPVRRAGRQVAARAQGTGGGMA